MEAKAPPQPPPTPATPVHVTQSTYEQRYTQGDLQVVVRTRGDVEVTAKDALAIGESATVEVELRSDRGVVTLVWDAAGCTMRAGQEIAACDAVAREFIVSNLAQRPSPPIPPSLRRRAGG